ncbi:butyrophilin subfamily 1 member A1-like [Sparus aurata]|uniref:butyrophilin subfamily 1 member A1-like n=1 Tax=Sparus aurata TaxID=8175 RepID=UPI0011C0D871|nr:butyrophilin subfamily 1 member A1-like [Sparus aurata]
MRFSDELKRGNISLKLSRVRISDEGRYRCFIPDVGDSSVQLIPGAVSSPFIVRIERSSSGHVVLQCESTGWYPEPEVFWLDGEGNLLSAGPTETVRGPDDLYTVSSRVTVEKRHSNSFTCRVQQNHINQTRETEIKVSADCFEFTSCSAHVAVLVVFVLLFIVAAVCVVWKWRQIQTKERKKQQEDQTEREQLISERTEDLRKEMVKLKEELKEKDETLKKNKEEQKDFEQEVYSKLTEQSEELQKQREKLRQQQTDMETNITVIEKEMQSVEKMAEGERFHRMKEITLTAKTQLNKRKQEDENLNLQTQTILNKTTELLKKITDRKKEEAQGKSQ